MHDLRLVAVTPERTHLVLEDDDNEQFRVPIDERLTAAMRHDHSRPGQLEIALDSPLSPRDIQARVRSGQSAQDVAAASGMPLARVDRYAGPVLAEREHVAQQAKAAPSRRQSGGSAPTLGDQVTARLTDLHVADDSVTWDAWRTDEDRWTVHLSYLAGARERVALWVFDPRGRVLVPDNDEARWLVDEDQVERDESPPRASAASRWCPRSTATCRRSRARPTRCSTSRPPPDGCAPMHRPSDPASPSRRARWPGPAGTPPYRPGTTSCSAPAAATDARPAHEAPPEAQALLRPLADPTLTPSCAE